LLSQVLDERVIGVTKIPSTTGARMVLDLVGNADD